VTGELVEQNAGQEAWSKYSVTSLPEEWACQDSRCAPYCGAAGAPPAAPAPAPGAGPAPMPTVPLPTQPPVGQTPGTRPLNVTIQLRRFPVVVLRPMTFGPRPLQPKSAAPPAAPAPLPPLPVEEPPALVTEELSTVGAVATGVLGAGVFVLTALFSK